MTATPPPIPIPSNVSHLPPLSLPMPASSSRSPPAFLTSRERERDRAHPYNRRQSISVQSQGQSPMPPRMQLDHERDRDYSSMRSTAGPISPLERESSSSNSMSASYFHSPHGGSSYSTGGDSYYREREYDSPAQSSNDLTRSRSRSQSYAARSGPDSGDRVAFSLPPLHTLAHFGERMGMPTPPLGEMRPPGGSPGGFGIGIVPSAGNGAGSVSAGSSSLGLAGLRPSYAYDSAPVPVHASATASSKRYDNNNPPSPCFTPPVYPYSRQASYISQNTSSSLPTPARSRSHSSASAPGTATLRMAGLALNKHQQQQQQQQQSTGYDRFEGTSTPVNAAPSPGPGTGVPQNRRMAHLQSEQKRRESINTGFAALRSVLPASLATDSKAIVLRKAVAHIQKLESMLPHAARHSCPPQRVKDEVEDAQMIYDSDDESEALRRVSSSPEGGKQLGWECVQVEDVRLEM